MQQRAEREKIAIEEDLLRKRLDEARSQKFAYNDVLIFRDLEEITGMAGIGGAVWKSDDQPVAALHLTTPTDRLQSPRREELVEMAYTEAIALRSELSPLLEAPSQFLR